MLEEENSSARRRYTESFKGENHDQVISGSQKSCIDCISNAMTVLFESISIRYIYYSDMGPQFMYPCIR